MISLPRLSLVFALLAFSSGQLASQTVPPLVNYQGQLTDDQGSPLPTADYVLAFRIFDAAIGGIQIWGPQVFDGTAGAGRESRVPVVHGSFNVLLGPVDTQSRSLNNAFNGTNRWLEIQVGNQPPITPRQQILSVPYAMRALAADQAANALQFGGQSSAAYVTRTHDERVGIGTVSAAERLHVAGGKAVIEGANRGPIDPSTFGTPNTGTFYDMITQREGGLSGLGVIEASGVDSPVLWMYDHPNNAFHVRRVPPTLTRNPAVEGQSLLIVKSDGNVGIGTTMPGALLDVRGDVIFGNVGQSNNNRIVLRGPNLPLGVSSHQDILWQFASAGSATIRAYRGGSWDSYLQFLTNPSLPGGNNPEVRMHLHHNGNVGIGTTSPLERLHVNGRLGIPLATSQDNNSPGIVAAGTSRDDFAYHGVYLNHYGFGFHNVPGPGRLYPYISGYFGVDLFTGGQHRLRVDVSGNTGIGTNTPAFRLHVNGSAGKPGGGSWSVASDRRLKHSIEPLSATLERLLKLRGRSFAFYDPDGVGELPGRQIGMIAQEVEDVFPEWVDDGKDGNKRLTFRGFEALTVEAFRDLRAEKDAEITELRTRLAALEAVVQVLAARPEGVVQ